MNDPDADPSGGNVRRAAAKPRPILSLHLKIRPRCFIVTAMAVKDIFACSGARPPLLGWPRLRVMLTASAAIGLLMSVGSVTPTIVWLGRTLVVGISALLAFGLLQERPARLPRWLARWVLQLVGIVISVPLSALLGYWLTTGGHPNFAADPDLVEGYWGLTFAGILFSPWIAVGALVRQRDAFARDQAMAFALERSELERKAMDARFRLLQAQVEPHFLFNTLANVQALVEAGAPQSSKVLQSLIAYLRAAVPRLHETATSLGQELDLVHAYLDVMHMRMPDRLKFAMRSDPGMRDLQCPPMTLLTLVENAVRHGIDPSETGGSIEVDLRLVAGRCVAAVTDTGLGIKATGTGLGTGLAALRERLHLSFGADADLRLSEITPHGVRADLSFPARKTPS